MADIVFSDLHLGNSLHAPALDATDDNGKQFAIVPVGTDDFQEIDRVKSFYDFYKTLVSTEDRVIFAGDTLELWQCTIQEVVGSYGWLLRYVCSIPKQVIFILGNHECTTLDLKDALSSALPAPVYRSKVLVAERYIDASRSYMVIHGHQYDKFISRNTKLSRAATWIAGVIERVHPNFDEKCEELMTDWQNLFKTGRSSDEGSYSEALVKECLTRKLDFAVYGHTHKLGALRPSLVGHPKIVPTYNPGCWVNLGNTGAIIIRKNNVEVVSI